MTAEEYFTKRERIAKAFGVDEKFVPAEAVWFLDMDAQLGFIPLATFRAIIRNNKQEA